MTTTSERLSAAAAALAGVLTHGHRDLRLEGDLTIAAQARDQVLATLAGVHAHLFAAQHDSVEMGPSDLFRHPVLGLGYLLRTRPATQVLGPAPTDLALHPPHHPTAAAWVATAEALDRAAVDVGRRRPNHNYSATTWTSGLPAPHEPADPPRTAWALTADIAALAAALTVADEDLAAALKRSDDTGHVRAGEILLHHSLGDLRLASALVLRLAEAGPLPATYHLQDGHHGGPVRAISHPTDLEPGLEQAARLLADGPALTGPQHRALATAVAAIAHTLTTNVPDQARGVLDNLALAAARYAAVWATSPLAAAGPGEWTAVGQLRAAAGVIRSRLTDPDRPPQNRPPHDPMASSARLHPADPVLVARHLPWLLYQAAANLQDALAADAFFVPEPRTSSGWWPVSRHPVRRQLGTAARALQEAAGQASTALATTRPPAPDPSPAADVAARPARAVLRAATRRSLARPPHPAVPPSPGPVRLPGRRPAR